MSELQSALAIITGLITISVLAGGLYSVFRASAQDARIKRLQDERDDYLNRLNYIEPKLKNLEQQNGLLLAMHNPAKQIDQLKAQEQTNHDETLSLLMQQNQTLESIDRHLLQNRAPRDPTTRP